MDDEEREVIRNHIKAELLTRNPLFAGGDLQHQLRNILNSPSSIRPSPTSS